MMFNHEHQATSPEEMRELVLQVYRSDERAKKTMVQIGSPAVEPLIQELNREYDTLVKCREEERYNWHCIRLISFSIMGVLGEIGDARALEPMMKIYTVTAHKKHDYDYDKEHYAPAVALAKLKNPQANAQMQVKIVKRLPKSTEASGRHFLGCSTRICYGIRSVSYKNPASCGFQ